MRVYMTDDGALWTPSAGLGYTYYAIGSQFYTCTRMKSNIGINVQVTHKYHVLCTMYVWFFQVKTGTPTKLAVFVVHFFFFFFFFFVCFVAACPTPPCIRFFFCSCCCFWMTSWYFLSTIRAPVNEPVWQRARDGWLINSPRMPTVFYMVLLWPPSHETRRKSGGHEWNHSTVDAIGAEWLLLRPMFTNFWLIDSDCNSINGPNGFCLLAARQKNMYRSTLWVIAFTYTSISRLRPLRHRLFGLI